MALDLYEAVNPVALTAIARTEPEDPMYRLNVALPDQEVPNIEFVIDQLKKRNRAAKFRSYDAPVELSKSDPFIRQTGEIPALGTGYLVGEWQRLLQEQLRGAAIDPQLFDFATSYTRRGVAEIRARAEVARGQVLSTGKFTLTGEGGLVLEADFGVPGDNQATADNLWSDTVNADIIGDLTAWQKHVHDEYGVWVDTMILGKDLVPYVLNNQKLRGVSLAAIGITGSLTVDYVNQTLSSHNLPTIAVDATGRPVRPTRVDVDDSFVDTYPANKVTLYKAGALGSTLWGPTFDALEFAARGMIDARDTPGIIAWVGTEGNPGKKYTVVDAAAIPVIEQPWGMFIGTAA